jgi:hypothetical protein
VFLCRRYVCCTIVSAPVRISALSQRPGHSSSVLPVQIEKKNHHIKKCDYLMQEFGEFYNKLPSV